VDDGGRVNASLHVAMQYYFPSLLTIMRLLPPSLLLASLAVVAAAAPVALNVLTPENFEQTIAKGVWYVLWFPV
jgi:hypothetical protein